MTEAASKSKAPASSKADPSVKSDPQPSTVSSASVKPSAPPKKRKRATKKDKTAPEVEQARPQAPPPTHILVIDNGGDTIKYGWNTDSSPQHIPNVTARLQQQWTVLAVSKRLLDLLGVKIPLHTETAQAFGWNANKNKANNKTDLPPKNIASQNCAVLLTVPPHCPRSILHQVLQVWLQDFDFSHVGFCVASACAAAEHAHPDFKTCCLMDLGWSATQIVPTYRNRMVEPAAIRRLPVAGRHLINM
jgi:actin-related protein